MKKIILIALAFCSITPTYSQATYEQRIQMAQNSGDPKASDIRYLIHNSSSESTDQELIDMLNTIKIADQVKREISVESAFTLNRLDFAVYMAENGYKLPQNLSSIFSKPFSDGAKNHAQPIQRTYSDQEMLKYFDFFIAKGVPVDFRTVEILNERNKPELSKYVHAKMTPEELLNYHKIKVFQEFNTQKPNYEIVDSILAISTYKLGDDFLVSLSNAPVEKVKEARKRGAGINGKDSKGVTYLMKSIEQGNRYLVEYLMNDPEIDLCAKNNEGQGVYSYLKNGPKRMTSFERYSTLLKLAKETCGKS